MKLKYFSPGKSCQCADCPAACENNTDTNKTSPNIDKTPKTTPLSMFIVIFRIWATLLCVVILIGMQTVTEILIYIINSSGICKK